MASTPVVLMPAAMKEQPIFGEFWEMDWFLTTYDGLSSLAADSTATVTVGDAVGGIAAIFTDTTDNNEASLFTTHEIFLLAADKPMFGEASIQYTEVSTNTANVLFGFANALGSANMLVDNGAGPKTNFYGAVIYKVDGSLVWKCMASTGTTQVSNSTSIATGGSAYHKFRIEFGDYTSLLCQVTYWIDEIQCRDATTNLPIVHTIDMTSATEMMMGVCAKTGTTGGLTVNVDYMAGYQQR